jgi:hypothetical protein
MKIFSTKILPARLEEDLSGDEVIRPFKKSRAWLSNVENKKTKISRGTEEQIVVLIRRLGALKRQMVIEQQRLAADIVVPAHAPAHYGRRKRS